MDNDISYFAATTFRCQNKPFGIRQSDRRYHMYVVGKTGTGKSTLLETLMRGDIAGDRSFALLDPHGDLVEAVREQIPPQRLVDLIYFDATDPECSLGFNPLGQIPASRHSLAASGLIDAFRKIWIDSWGPRLEHVLRNCILALLEQGNATLGDILRLLTDSAFRKQIARGLANKQVREFWLKEFEDYPLRSRAEAIAPIQNKVGAFLSDPLLNRILSTPQNSFKLRQIMDSGKILLVNLAKGRIGLDSTRLLGALLVAQISLAALSRVDRPEPERRDFFLYLDEFHNFATETLVSILAEMRKFRCSLVCAHQYLTQIERPILDGILGNAGTIISFRVGAHDAQFLQKEFLPEFEITDLVNLPNHEIYLRLMINGAVSKPFSAKTLGRADGRRPLPGHDNSAPQTR